MVCNNDYSFSEPDSETVAQKYERNTTMDVTVALTIFAGAIVYLIGAGMDARWMNKYTYDNKKLANARAGIDFTGIFPHMFSYTY